MSQDLVGIKEELCAKELSTPLERECFEFLLTFSAVNTRLAYTRALKKFFTFWKEKGLNFHSAATVQRSHIDAWKIALLQYQRPSTVCAQLAALFSFFKFAYEANWILKDISKGIRFPKVQKHKVETEALSEDELKRTLKQLKYEFTIAHTPQFNTKHRRAWLKYCLFLTMCSVGMRVSEVAQLQIKDFDCSGEFPRLCLQTKGGLLHAPLISDALSELLKLYISTLRRLAHKDDPLFTVTPLSKKPLSRRYIARLMTTIAIENGIQKQFSPHSCRATVASLLHKQGVPVGEIQDLLGHRSIITTMRYIKKIDEEKQSAARKNPVFDFITEE